MRTITKIACRTVGTIGIGLSLYNASKVSSLFAKNQAQNQQQKYLEKTFFNSRTIDTVNYNKNAIRKKTFDFTSKNPIPSFWGKIKGGIRGFIYGLGDSLPVIICSAFALLSKNSLAKAGAIGTGLCYCYNIIRDGLGFGKQHPMD